MKHFEISLKKMRGLHIYHLCGWLGFIVVMMSFRTANGIRSMVMRPQARDLSLGSNDLQGLQSMWAKESQEDEPSLALALDPRKTWEAFISNSERQKKARRRKNKKRNRKIPLPKEGPQGPPGPRGPPGPPGRDGGTLSTQEMEEYIVDYLREYFEDHHNDTRRQNEVDDNLSGEDWRRGRVRVAFSAILPRPPTVKPAALSIIDSFTITFSPGLFERRIVLEHGGFTVTKNGLYQVAASLVIHPKGMSNTALIPKNDVHVYMCVNNCNKDNRRLEWAGSISEGPVTAVLTGHIMLRRGNTLLIGIDNTSERQLQIGTGSSFSAAMIGT